MEKDWLVEVRSNFPRELEVTAESEEQALDIARRKLDMAIDRLYPDFELGRITESGENKGIIWNDGE